MKRQLKALRDFQDNAGCAHTHRKASRMWRELEPYLTQKQRRRLSTARAHHSLGEGRGELDTVCEEIRAEWIAQGGK